MRRPTRSTVIMAILLLAASRLASQEPHLDKNDMPMQPNGRWPMHDPTRPQPRVVIPAPAPAEPVAAPTDATILLGARDDLTGWQTLDGRPATWRMSNGVVEVGGGDIRTRQEFTDFQLHVEFATPADVRGDGQGRGNSGVYLLGAFEIRDPRQLPQSDLSRRPGGGDVRPVSAASERITTARRMANL